MGVFLSSSRSGSQSEPEREGEVGGYRIFIGEKNSNVKK
jgi:hypothetical protein